MNPIPFVTASAPNARSPTSRRREHAANAASRSPDDAVLEYWERVRAGAEPLPRPGAEARMNKRRCAHLESHIGDVLGFGGTAAAREREREEIERFGATENAHALEVGESLGEAEVAALKARSMSMSSSGRARGSADVRERAAAGGRWDEYAMPLAPEDEGFGEEVEEELDADCFFEYGRDELPRHMRDWYRPPEYEYGSFATSGDELRHGSASYGGYPAVRVALGNARPRRRQ